MMLNDVFPVQGKSGEIAVTQDKKRILAEGVGMFNEKPSQGLDFLQQHSLLDSPFDARQVAVLLKTHPAFDKVMIGEFLGRNKEFNLLVLKEFVKSFDYSDKVREIY